MQNHFQLQLMHRKHCNYIHDDSMHYVTQETDLHLEMKSTNPDAEASTHSHTFPKNFMKNFNVSRV